MGRIAGYSFEYCFRVISLPILFCGDPTYCEQRRLMPFVIYAEQLEALFGCMQLTLSDQIENGFGCLVFLMEEQMGSNNFNKESWRLPMRIR